MKRITGPRQHDTVGDTIAFEVDILQHEFLQLIKAAEIEHVFEACEGEILRSFGIIKRFGKRCFAGIDIHRGHIDLAANAIAFNQ